MNIKGKTIKPLNGEKSQKIASSIALCLFASFNVCFYMPMDIYIANANDIEIPVKPLAACLGLITLGLFAVTLLICLLTRGKANRISCAVIFGVSAALYIQGNFLAVNMGMLNGEQYETPIWKITLNIFIWLAVLAIPFIILRKLPDEFDWLVSHIAAAVFIVQLAALGISAYNNIPKYDGDKLNLIFNGESVSYCSMLDFDLYSKNKNLIIIVADEYDSFLFDGAMEQAPDSISEFDGFTYYTNTVGSYRMTHSSLSYITSGDFNLMHYYDRTFYQNAAANFKTGFYSSTAIPPASVMAEYCENVGFMNLSLDETVEYSKSVYRLAFFRCMPEILKPLFWFDGSNIGKGLTSALEKRTQTELGTKLYDYDNLAFYNNLPQELVSTDENVFKFIYLLGVHSPRYVTKDLQPAENGISPEEEAIAVNKIVNEYFKILKENGVYDNSEIIFMADHGLSGHLDKKFPMLMYKPAHQTETGIKISNAPISYDDMFPTLIKLTGGEPQARTIFDIAEDEERVRYFAETNETVIGNIKGDYEIISMD